MGMSASQARLIALTARMNDIEYQGQQINQQRTTLANQVNALYNSLLDMTVPTPPSTKDFTKVVYSGKQGASSFTLGNVTPGKEENTYNVDMKYSKTGHSWESTADINVNTGKIYYPAITVAESQIDEAVQKNAKDINKFNGNIETLDLGNPQEGVKSGTDIYVSNTKILAKISTTEIVIFILL